MMAAEKATFVRSNELLRWEQTPPLHTGIINIEYKQKQKMAINSPVLSRLVLTLLHFGVIHFGDTITVYMWPAAAELILSEQSQYLLSMSHGGIWTAEANRARANMKHM